MITGVHCRALLKAGGAALAGGLAGCSGDGGQTSPTPSVDLDLPATDGCPEGSVLRLAVDTSIGEEVRAAYGSDLYDGPLFLAHEHFYVPLQNARGLAHDGRLSFGLRRVHGPH